MTALKAVLVLEKVIKIQCMLDSSHLTNSEIQAKLIDIKLELLKRETHAT
jgi:hypothetical protein